MGSAIKAGAEAAPAFGGAEGSQARPALSSSRRSRGNRSKVACAKLTSTFYETINYI